MADADYQVVFDGQLVEGADPMRVRENLARLFKTDVARVEPLFAGYRRVIKRGLDEATARKYCLAIRRGGALAVVVGPDGEVPLASPSAPSAPVPEPPVAPRMSASAMGEPSPPAAIAAAGDVTPHVVEEMPAGDAEELSRLQMAEAGPAPPPLAVRGTPSVPDDMSMAEAGAILVEEGITETAPAIDTSHLSLSELGAELDEAKPVEAPEYNLDDLALAPPGEILADPGDPRGS